MSKEELPPPLPPGRRQSPVPAHVPKPVVPAPLPAQSNNPSPAAPAFAGTGRLWWAWGLSGFLACVGLFVVTMSCNPATTATDRALGKVYGAVAQSVDRDFGPLLSWLFGMFFDSFIAGSYVQMQAAGLTFAFFVALLIPLGWSVFSLVVGHPVFMIGGAPGGWRASTRAFGIHRFACDGLTLLLLFLVMILPMEPVSAGALLFLFMPLIRVGAMVTLLVLLARSHSFGALRIIFLGLPYAFFVSGFSALLSLVLALYFYLYLVARSF